MTLSVKLKTMKTRHRNIFLTFLALFILAGCSSLPDPGGEPLPSMTFNHVQPIGLDVAQKSVVKHDNIHRRSSADFIRPLDNVVQSYFSSKVAARGNAGDFRIEIHDASVRMNKVQAGREMARFLGVFGLDEYVLNVEALLVLERPDIRKTVKMRAGRTIRVSEHSSITNRERDQYVALEELVRSLDKEFTRVLQTDFGDYIR